MVPRVGADRRNSIDAIKLVRGMSPVRAIQKELLHFHHCAKKVGVSQCESLHIDETVFLDVTKYFSVTLSRGNYHNGVYSQD
jgi:hypothetical protein